jgi:hypothetical protein
MAVARPHPVHLAQGRDEPATPRHRRPAVVGLTHLPRGPVDEPEAPAGGDEKGVGVVVHGATILPAVRPNGRRDYRRSMADPTPRVELLDEARQRFAEVDPLRPLAWGCGGCGGQWNFAAIRVLSREPQCPGVDDHVGWEVVFPVA